MKGRGWSKVGAHAPAVNSNSIGICIIGTFKTTPPNALALKAVQDLIACGVSRGYLKSAYILKGHRQVTATDCPGFD